MISRVSNLELGPTAASYPGIRREGSVWYRLDGPGTGILRSGARKSVNDLLNRISVDPQVCGGKPSVRGTRIWVSLLLDFLASGSSMEEVLGEYPQLTRDDLLAAIAYGAEMSRERFVDLPGTSAA